MSISNVAVYLWTGWVGSCRVLVNCQCREEFGVGVDVHQGYVLSPLLFIHLQEALLQPFLTGVSWEFLYADDLAVMADLLEECINR